MTRRMFQRLGLSLILLAITCLAWPHARAAAQASPLFTGDLHINTRLQTYVDQYERVVGIPEVTTRLRLLYDRPTMRYNVRVLAEAEGVWGARPGYNTEPDIAAGFSLREVNVTTVNPLGAWTFGRQTFLTPDHAGDYRRFNLLVGSGSATADGVSWYRPIGPLEIETAVGYIDVRRNPATGILETGDLWSAVRISSLIGGRGWQLRFAPTRLLSDTGGAHGWSVPALLRTRAHQIEMEYARYRGEADTFGPSAWYDAWVARWEPLRPLPVPIAALEAASIAPGFAPHMSALAHPTGELGWLPGQRGVSALLKAGPGQLGIAWRKTLQRNAGEEHVSTDIYEVTYRLPSVPQPSGTTTIKISYRQGLLAAELALSSTFRF